MDLIQIKGGNFLEGEINISGSKNAALPIIIASLLTRDKVKIKNIPNLSDIFTLLKLIKTLGSEYELKNENNELNNIYAELLVFYFFNSNCLNFESLTSDLDSMHPDLLIAYSRVLSSEIRRLSPDTSKLFFKYVFV